MLVPVSHGIIVQIKRLADGRADPAIIQQQDRIGAPRNPMALARAKHDLLQFVALTRAEEFCLEQNLFSKISQHLFRISKDSQYNYIRWGMVER